MTSTLDFPVTPATASDGYAQAELGFAPLAPRTRSHHGIAPTPRRVSAAVQPDLGLHPADPVPVEGQATPVSAGQEGRAAASVQDRAVEGRTSVASGAVPSLHRGRSSTTQDERGLVPAAPPAALGLLAQAEQGLTAAVRQPQPAQRFAEAYLCALRAAAALLAARGRPHRGRAKPTSVWTLLSSVAPEMREWAAFFASCSTTRAAVQAGITSRVGPRAADDLVRQSGQFIALVHRAVHGDRR